MVDSTSLPQTSQPGIRLAGEHLEPGHVAHEPTHPEVDLPCFVVLCQMKPSSS